MTELALLILAAGKGTRMRSRRPKVLQPVCGRPILLYALGLGPELGARRSIVVVDPDQDEVRETLSGRHVEWVEQAQPLGTAHAVIQARDALKDHPGPVLIMYGDHPLYRAATFSALLEVARSSGAELAVLTGRFPDPSGYGRIVRGRDGRIERIVEEADASPEVRRIQEINLGVYVTTAPFLFQTLARVDRRNEQGEFYLTDLVELALASGEKVETHTVEDWRECIGVNDRADLAQAEALMRQRINAHWMEQGVSFVDPDHTYVDADVSIGPDTWLEPGVRLRGQTRVGANCRIEAGVVIDSSAIGDDTWVKPHCWIEQSTVGDRCILGPSAHLRPDSVLAREVRIGNFVEVKNSKIGAGTKADHLSYIGDADIGEGCTFACGAVTVNYDGQKKSRTVVGPRSFVGCNANLIAPITLAADSYVAAGSTITKEVPQHALAVARARQRNVEGWVQRRFGSETKDPKKD